MADFYGSARTNYFKVKDVEDFIERMEALEVHVQAASNGEVMVYSESEDGMFPSGYYDDDTGDYMDIDFYAMVSNHLTPDSIAIFFEIGNEKLRYLMGNALAVNSKGEFLNINLNHIYKMVEQEWGVKVPYAF